MKRLTFYKTVLDENRLPQLLKEKSINYNELEANNEVATKKILDKLFNASFLTEEHLYLFCLNVKLNPVAIFELSTGSQSSSIVETRNIFMKTFMSGCSHIILVHNHPSYDVSPSVADVQIAKRLKEQCDLMDVKLLDFIIIGGKDCKSFLKDGII